MPTEATAGPDTHARGRAHGHADGRAEARADAPSCPVEAISSAYLGFAGGDACIALRCAVADALSDLLDAERRTRERSRLISRGYVREAPTAARRS